MIICGGRDMHILLDGIVGNFDLKARICADISEGSLSHAYILEGRRGSGRRTLALTIAAALSCNAETRPCSKCKSCQKILSGHSPDIINITREEDKVTLGVDAIRKIKEDMATAPNDLDKKFYIINDADSMTVQAQNAFLLSLEDPPEYAMFFLICENATALLETVRSRAPALRLGRLSCHELEDSILSRDKRAERLKQEDGEAFKAVVFLSDGCMGEALSLLDAKKRKALFDQRETAERLISLLTRPDRAAALGMISAIGTKRTEVQKYLTSAQYALRDLILLKKTDSAPLSFYIDRENAQELSTRFSSSSLISLYDAICSALSELEANANVRLTLLGMAQNAGLI